MAQDKARKTKAGLNGVANGSKGTYHGRANGAALDAADFAEDRPFSTSTDEKRQVGGSPTAIDDPVRMYLMQMGEIPMLSRKEEVNAAARIEYWRRRFRISMMASDLILQGAVHALEKVQKGELRLDRTIEVSVTNTAEKKRIVKRLGPNLDTLRRLLVENHTDYRIAIRKGLPIAKRRLAWRRMIRRRYRAVRLVEEMNLRLNRLTPLLDRLNQISQRMNFLQSQLRNAATGDGRSHPSGTERANSIT